MRIPRKRVFKIMVNGLDSWIEEAGERCAVELQHKLTTNTLKGSSVRVVEQYLGGAKVQVATPNEEEEET